MNIRAWAFLASFVLIAGCGGGGGGGGTDPGDPPPPPPTSGTPRLVSATAEKGPFVIGSSVSVNRLNAQAQPTASTLTTETEDNLGNFSFSIEPGPVSISVDGFHFNEITGSLANGRLTLRAIYEVADTESQRAHVNLLTHLIHLRVETLVRAGSSIPAAIQTAQTELTDQLAPVFGPFSPENFSNYSVYASDSTSSDGAGYILAVSAAIYQFAINRGGISGFDAELALIINNLSDDFADGVIHLQWILDGIDAGAMQVDPAQLSENLVSHAASVGFTAEPADASMFIDTDRDGLMNAVDDDDDNDGIPDVDDPSPLTPANKPPVISGELPRYVISGHYYENFLTATDADGDRLTVLSMDGGSGFGATIDPPGNHPGTVLPPPTLEGYTLTVAGFSTRPPGVYPITITVSDGEDIAVYETELEIIAATDAPILVSDPPTVGFRGEVYSGSPRATNPRGTNLVWTIESGPDWLSIDSATGELSGTIPLDHRSILEPFPFGGFDTALQIEYCRMKTYVWIPNACPVDTVGIGIDDGTIKTVWPIYIDLFDTGEAQGPLVDGNTYRGVLADAVYTDTQNAIYVVGSSGGGEDGNNGLGLDDAFVKKLDDRQVEQWTRMVGSNGTDRVVSSVMDANEDIYLYIYSNGDWRSFVGDTSTPTGNKRLLAKVLRSGNVDWAVEFPDSADITVERLPLEIHAPYLAALPGGGVRILINGELFDVDPLGIVSSHASINPGFNVRKIAVAEDGSTVLAGEFYLSRLDPSGVESWQIEFDPTRQLTWSGRSIAFDANGAIVVAGEGLNAALDGGGWFLARYGIDGSQDWFNRFTFADDQKFNDLGPNGVSIDGTGNIIVAGRMWLESFTTDPNGGDYDTVSKFDSSGNLLWYNKLWRVDGYKHMSVTSNSTNDLVVVGSGTVGPRLEYPNQFECTEQEPCQRHLRLARNDWATLNESFGGGHDYFLLTLDPNGAER